MLMLAVSQSLRMNVFPFSIFIQRHCCRRSDISSFGFWYAVFISHSRDFWSRSQLQLPLRVLHPVLIHSFSNKGVQIHMQLCWWGFTGALCSSSNCIRNTWHFLWWCLSLYPWCLIGPWFVCHQLICTHLTFSVCC